MPPTNTTRRTSVPIRQPIAVRLSPREERGVGFDIVFALSESASVSPFAIIGNVQIRAFIFLRANAGWPSRFPAAFCGGLVSFARAHADPFDAAQFRSTGGTA